jgi:hypothetical protein
MNANTGTLTEQYRKLLNLEGRLPLAFHGCLFLYYPAPRFLKQKKDNSKCTYGLR